MKGKLQRLQYSELNESYSVFRETWDTIWAPPSTTKSHYGITYLHSIKLVMILTPRGLVIQLYQAKVASLMVLKFLMRSLLVPGTMAFSSA